jgi:hypothetical protein
VSLEQAGVIDALGIDAASGRVVLVIRHDAPWDGSAGQLFLLQEKLNAYLSFALDGEMADAYPDFANRPLGVRVESPAAPDPRTLGVLAGVRRQLAFQDITLEVRPGQASDCGSGCGCHS